MAAAISWVDAVLLGIMQGLTEWLPVSSSGHLVLLRAYREIDVPLFFDLVLHMATLLVVAVFYRSILRDMALALARWPQDARSRGWRQAGAADPDRRLFVFLVIGTLPIVLAALAFGEWFEARFASPSFVGWTLIATGFFLWFTRRSPSVTTPGKPLSWQSALVIGIAQIAAILPGISRSGTTVGTALYAGVEPEAAVRYSFLLSIPTILGATLFQARHVEALGLADNWPAYVLGFLMSLIVGYASLRFLVALVRNRVLHWFAPYCWLAGAVTLFSFGLAV